MKFMLLLIHREASEINEASQSQFRTVTVCHGGDLKWVQKETSSPYNGVDRFIKHHPLHAVSERTHADASI